MAAATARTTPMADACARAARQLEPAGFFVLRTPLLAFTELLREGAPLDRLRELAGRPIVRDAIRVASPSTYEALEGWLGGATDQRSQAIVPTVARYLYRMCGRATPYGLFASQTLGEVVAAHETNLDVGDELTRRTHVDRGFLAQLVAALEREPALEGELLFSPTPGLTRVGDTFVSLERDARSERLVSFLFTPELERVLARAEGGATRGMLVAALIEAEPTLDAAEARSFVDALIDGRVLSSDLEPSVSAGEPVSWLARHLNDRPACGQRAALAKAAEVLAQIDAAGPGVDPRSYQQLDVAFGADSPVPLHVDLFRDGSPKLGRAVTRELSRAIDLSLRIGVTRTDHDLLSFCRRFRERWEDAEVPLMVALDADAGVGFHADVAPPSAVAMRRNDHLLRRLIESEAAGARCWELGEADLVALEAESVAPIPDSLCLWGLIAAPSAAALASGDFKLWQFPAWYGGATMLGRFCHDHAALREAVSRHLAAEAALRPETIFPEVLYAPPGRVHNLVARPTLRDWELPLFTRGTAPPERTLDLADLVVSVRGGRARLRSARLGKWVAPRMTHAHSVGKDGLPLLRFLTALQAADLPMLPEWSWDPVYRAPHLPRVEHGRLVLALERWNLMRDEVATLAGANPAARQDALQRLRHSRRLPRFVSLIEGTDQSLVVDLDDALSCESLLERVRAGQSIVLCELFPPADALPSSGAGGRHVAELLVPFQSTRAPSPPEPQPPPLRATRSFSLGSEWLYAKVYASRARSDVLLSTVLAPLMQRCMSRGDIDDWFFIRYADPEPHLRLRCHGEPEALLSRVLPALRRALEPALANGDVERLALDSYRREIERYGGDAGIELCERVFSGDSAAVAELVAGPDEGQRWYQALLGADRLLEDLAPDANRALELALAARTALRSLLGDRATTDTALAGRFRSERAAIDHWLDSSSTDRDVRAARAIFERRSKRLAPAMLCLRERAGVRDAVTGSLLHMHVNRMFQSYDPLSELALLDAIWRTRRADVARGRSRGSDGR